MCFIAVYSICHKHTLCKVLKGCAIKMPFRASCSFYPPTIHMAVLFKFIGEKHTDVKRQKLLPLKICRGKFHWKITFLRKWLYEKFRNNLNNMLYITSCSPRSVLCHSLIGNLKGHTRRKSSRTNTRVKVTWIWWINIINNVCAKTHIKVNLFVTESHIY